MIQIFCIPGMIIFFQISVILSEEPANVQQKSILIEKTRKPEIIPYVSIGI